MCRPGRQRLSPVDDIVMQFSLGNETDGDYYNVRTRAAALRWVG